jgi:hypothetical protein
MGTMPMMGRALLVALLSSALFVALFVAMIHSARSRGRHDHHSGSLVEGAHEMWASLWKAERADTTQSHLARTLVFGAPEVRWASLWQAKSADQQKKLQQPRSPQLCRDESLNLGSQTTFAGVAVELRVYPPLIGSLNLSHRFLPISWPFHIFHSNFTRDRKAEHWYLQGEMAQAIRNWQAAGREVNLHTYNDQWHKDTKRHKTRPSNTYPRMRDFWTKYFFEDKIVTLQSDTGFCPNSPYKLKQFTGVDFNGATWGSDIFERGRPGQGGLSWRNRHAMYNCLDWLQDTTQHRGNRSVLWSWEWTRNEDAMFVKCMSGATKGGAKIHNWEPHDPSSRGTRLNYHVGSMCLANKWSREHPLIDALIKGHAPPFGLHAICRSIESYGKCAWVQGAERGPKRPGEPPVVQAYKCKREGFSVDRAFDAFSQYCGADLTYMRACYDYNASSSSSGRVRLLRRPNMDAGSRASGT